MKKHILTLVFISLFAAFGFANVVTGVAAIPDGYYNQVDNTTGATNILSALNSAISNHTVLNYNSLESYYEQTDFYGDTLWDMYSTCRFTMAEANKQQSAVCDGWNKEHLVCQSWFSGSGMKSDLFNVYPTDARVNGMRSNFAYGEVNGAYGTGISNNNGHALGKKGSNTFPGYTGTVFEPHDDYKGDFARSFMYMAACYRTGSLNASYGSAMYTATPTNLTTYAQNLLMKWHRQDPVSQKEIDRNQAVYTVQGNRNPFIDYPELAEYIWGTKVGQTVALSTMTPTCEGGVTPPDPTPVTKYGLNWSVNGVIILTDSIKENNRPFSIPEAPVSCSSESDTFMGWTDAAISGTTDDAPAVLYHEASAIPALTADMTLYAVFAKANVSGASTPATYTYDADHKDGWTNTATLKNSYWLLETGKTIVSPEIDLMTLESITVMMRTYGGKQYNQLDIYEADGKLTSITAQDNSLKEYTWMNNLYIAGTSALTFSSSYGTGVGIGIQSIVIRAAGASTTYSRFITSCQESTELLILPFDNRSARKILIGSQIYILLNNQLFNLQGQRVQ